MLPGSQDPKELGFYFALSQVGVEMVAPMLLGLVLDSYLGWKPWATLLGGAIGFVGGLAHLVVLANSANRPKDPDRNGGPAK